ncbi:Rho GTPase [Zygosaccharomyces mellis]|uniref:GTP-binding protein RHO3 n=1 Tax=Zygosaccharomyces mellis TaxID=42258 RepID=A0A4C2E2L9_9SACH|nr:Rho GTPase [Zygosaccharomyces mellis]
MTLLCGSSSGQSSKKSIERKIVILGDGACGKTSLLNVFTRGYFPKVYEPTVFENYIHDIFVDNKHITLSLWDTAGQEEFDRLRSLSYSDTDVIMLCFSLDSRDSLMNVQHKWVGEIADHCEGVKLVLVALKCDLRRAETENAAITPNLIQQQRTNQSRADLELNGSGINSAKNSDVISYEEGVEMAKKIGALRYLECSAKFGKGVNEAFTEATRVVMNSEPRNKETAERESSRSGCAVM